VNTSTYTAVDNYVSTKVQKVVPCHICVLHIRLRVVNIY